MNYTDPTISIRSPNELVKSAYKITTLSVHVLLQILVPNLAISVCWYYLPIYQFFGIHFAIHIQRCVVRWTPLYVAFRHHAVTFCPSHTHSELYALSNFNSRLPPKQF